MGLHWQFGVVQNAGSPLEASLIADGSAALVDIIEHPAPAGNGAFTTGAGGIQIHDLSVAASGGSGSYTFSWANSEIRDDANVYSVASAGATNAARYNTLQLTCSTPSGAGSVNTGIYNQACTVSDGTDSVVVNHSVTVNAIALP